MANGLYTKARTAFAEGALHWKSAGGDTFKAILIDTADYTADLANDEYLSDIPSAARVSTVTLATLTPTDGVLDASDSTFLAVSGDPCEAIVIYQHTGTESTSILVVYIDTAVAGLPVTPVGGLDIAVTWPSGADKIAKI